MRANFYIIVLSLLFLWQGIGAAELVSIQFTCFDWSREAVDDLYIKRGESFELVAMRNLKRSAPLPYEGAPLLQFYQKDSASELGYRLLAEASIPVELKRVLLVLVPWRDKERNLPYRVYVLEDSLENFPKNSFRIINMGEVPLIVYFNEEEHRLESKGRLVLRSGLQDAGYHTVMMKTLEGELLYSSKWYSEPVVRELVFLAVSSGARGRAKLKLRMLPEVVATHTVLKKY